MAIGFTAELSHYPSPGRYATRAGIDAAAAPLAPSPTSPADGGSALAGKNCVSTPREEVSCPTPHETVCTHPTGCPPGFERRLAEGGFIDALYKGNERHYASSAVAQPQLALPRQLPTAPRRQLPTADQPYHPPVPTLPKHPGGTSCGPCYSDGGSCVTDCVRCPPGVVIDGRGCEEFTRGCRDGDCCPSGQEPCFVTPLGLSCCPSGTSCCDPLNHVCCSPPEYCCFGTCCAPGEGCCIGPDGFGTCCPVGEKCCLSPDGQTGWCCAGDQACTAQGCCPQSDVPCGDQCCAVVLPAGSNAACCNGNCSDTNTDPDNCGGCAGAGGQVCTAPAGGTPTCSAGKCDFDCNPGLTKCSGQCVDVSTDPNNCGTCGTVCPAVTFVNGIDQFYGCCNSDPTMTPTPSCITLPSLSSAPPNPSSCSLGPTGCTGGCSNGNTNYWIAAANCANISGLSVTLDPQPRLTADNFSIQLNAVPPPSLSANPNQIQWMQYIFWVNSYTSYGTSPPTNSAIVEGWVEYWSQIPSTPPGTLCTSFATNNVGSACCSKGNCCTSTDILGEDTCNTVVRQGPFGYSPIPAGSDIASYQISLSTDTTGNVTQANFVVIDTSGNPSSLAVPIPTNVQAPIQAFQFVAVGLDNCAIANFDSGSGASIIYDSPSGQQLCIQGPSNSCIGGLSSSTGESSNATYGFMDACCDNVLFQSLSA
jgi:hypothetical protein